MPTSSGFLTPLLLALTADTASYPALLATLAAIGLLCLTITALHSRRHLPSHGTTALNTGTRSASWGE